MKKIVFTFLLLSFISISYAQSPLDLRQKAMEYFETGDNALAIEYAEKAIATAESGFGKDHQEYLSSLNDLATICMWTGDYQRAELLFTEALIITEKISGKDHPRYAASLRNLGELYYETGNYDKSASLMTEVLEILKKDPGRESIEYANSMEDLASVYDMTGNYAKAGPLYTEALNIRKIVSGKDNPDYAYSLTNVAYIQFEMGIFENALSLLEEASEIFLKVLGPDDPDYANSLNNLALLHNNLGNYKEAELLFLKALTIFKTIPVPNVVDYANTLDNFAGLYHNTGNFALAEPLYIEALNMRKINLGKDHPDYTVSLNNLATFYFELGNYVKAEPLFLEGLEIMKRILGTEHRDYATYLNNLALLYNETKNYEKAEPLYIEAMEIRKRVLGPENNEYAASLNNLACFYDDLDENKKAEPLYQEALLITKNAMGNRHPDYALSLCNLAFLYNDMNLYTQAEPLYLEALDIIEESQGADHPAYTAALNNLAALYINISDDEKAEALYIQANDNLNKQINNTFSFLSEKEKEQFLNNTVINFFKKYNSFFLRRKDKNPAITTVSYNNELAHKGMLLLSNTALRQAVYSSNNTELISGYEKFTDIHKKLSVLYTTSTAERVENMDSLENIANKLEKELISKGKDLRGVDNLTGLTKVKWKDVQEALSVDEVAIEFVSFNYFDKKWTDSVFYCALVLRKEYEFPKMLYLFEEKELEGLLSTELATTSSYYITKLYSGKSDLFPDKTGKADPDKNILFKLVWEPIDSLLEGVNTLYIAPCGLLHKVAFSAIPINDSANLSDRYSVNIMSSTRILAQEDRIPATFSGKDRAVLYGGIEYDIDSTDMIALAGQYRQTEYDFLASRSAVIPEDKRGVSWSYLPGTFTEISAIQRLFSAGKIHSTLYTGKSATEESFKYLTVDRKSPEIIHIATHGFFFPVIKTESDNQEKETFRGVLADKPAFTISDNPLFRSGLLLAGASRTWSNLQAIPGVEDGTLTAYEVSNLNLHNTRLVVLSACETGLGDIHGSEGVYGLQRAFKMAGVQYMIISLWQVPDYQTSELMQLFYSDCLRGMNIKDAFRNAQQTMRYKYDPFYWAAFVLVE